MKRHLLAGLLALTIVPALPAPARADCGDNAVGSCNDDFEESSEKLAGLLGWCYLIRLAWCGIEALGPSPDPDGVLLDRRPSLESGRPVLG